MTACQSCGAEIVWARTSNGKWISLDPLPVEDDNIALNNTQQPPVAHVVAAPSGRLFVSHFATCPDHAAHRRPR